MKVAIIHEWLESVAGSERVLEQMLLCYPEADLFALVDFLPAEQRGILHGRVPRTSFLQRLPFARRWFRHYAMLLPMAVEQWDLSGYDLVLSNSHAFAKGVLTGPDTRHVSYVHSPMRYAWDLQHQYLRESGLDRGLRGMATRWLLSRLRLWDRGTANGVDLFLTNSHYVARRINKAYRREAVVIPPPVDIETFTPGGEKGDFYLVASRHVAYKRIDLVAAAFAAMPDRPLVIVGDGPAHARVRAAARGAPNITFRPAVPQAELVALMRAARAFVFAGEEDFGIVLAEALACGTPVIAFGRGGAVEIVAEGAGVLFHEQTAEAVAEAVARFEAMAIDPAIGRAAVRLHASEHFRDHLRAALAAAANGAFASAGR
jgi:glycosyltransferase involved in cell wall biosynthesis